MFFIFFMDSGINALILKINNNAIESLEDILDKNKISMQKDTFQYIHKIAKNANKSKFYFPFISTFLVCLLRKKAPKNNTIVISSLFFLMEYFIDLKGKKLQKDISHFLDIANIIILEELKVDANYRVELLKKIKKISVSLKKSDVEQDNLDRVIKLKLTDNLKQIVDFLGLIFSLTEDESNKLKIYCDNISRLIYFEKKDERVDLLEMQKLSMMKSQSDKMLSKFEILGKDTLIKFSNSLLRGIENNSNQKSLAI